MTRLSTSDAPRPLPRRIGPVHLSMTSQPVLPAPSLWRVGIRIKTFEACSGFTRIAARTIAQLPKATFVTRLRSSQSPGQTARQLPDPSTLIRVESSTPILLTHSPSRCSVIPVAGIKLGIGRRLCVASDAEQRTEGVERVEAPVEPKREFVEVGL